MPESGYHDAADRRGVFLPLWVIDAVSGDLPVALVYAQVLWFHQPGLDGERRARFQRDGHIWLLRADDEWENEVRLTAKQVRRARKILVDAGLVECRRFKRNGAPTSAWRPNSRNPEVPLEGQFHGSDPQGVVGSDPGGEVPPLSETYLGDLEESPVVADAPTSPELDPIDSLCVLLASKIGEHSATGTEPPITERWRKDMRLLLERGPLHDAHPRPLPATKIEASIRYLFDRLATPEGRGAFCWADQIRSPGALRDHWVQLADAARRTQQAAAPAPSARERRIAANGLGSNLAEALGIEPRTEPVGALNAGGS